MSAIEEFDAETLERLFHVALQAGDIKGVEAALYALAFINPERADFLLRSLRLANDMRGAESDER